MTIVPPLAPALDQLVLYVDESGDHGMSRIDPHFPVLTIAGCAFRQRDYLDTLGALQDFKTSIVERPHACIHSSDIRKWTKDFAHVLSQAARAYVMSQLSHAIEASRFTLITVTIRKDRLSRQYADPAEPYLLAVRFLIERFYRLLNRSRTRGAMHFESRGRKEDDAVAATYDGCMSVGLRYADGRMLATPQEVAATMPWPLSFGSKANNCCGLEIADLCAWPIARYVIDPDRMNAAFTILRPKLYAGNVETTHLLRTGDTIEVGGTLFLDQQALQHRTDRYGLKVFP